VKQAYVRGLDLKNSLTRIVDSIAEDSDYRWKNFKLVMNDHMTSAVQSYVAEEDAQGAQMAQDRYEAIEVCLEKSKARNEDELKTAISDLFTERRNSTVLSTVHRSKGLESNRVMVLHPHNLRLYWQGQLPWQAYQEQCCEYVAITRAKENLIFVEESEKPYDIGERLQLPKEKL